MQELLLAYFKDKTIIWDYEQFSFVMNTWMTRDAERIDLYHYARCTETDCSCQSSDEDLRSCVSTGKSLGVRIRLHAGYYHDRYRDLAEVELILLCKESSA